MLSPLEDKRPPTRAPVRYVDSDTASCWTLPTLLRIPSPRGMRSYKMDSACARSITLPLIRISLVLPQAIPSRSGPMLLHGLQGLHRSNLIVPHHLKDRPDPERLEMRYKEFLRAG